MRRNDSYTGLIIMMYAINDNILKNNDILEMINNMDCVLLFEPENDIYYISFKNK